MFEKDIKEYEDIRKEYQQKLADRMGKNEWMEYNEILFSAHSCAIEGNSFTEPFLKEVNRLVTEHTLSYRAPEAKAGEYTTKDMAAGDTIFGDHEKLIARVPALMTSTQKALDDGQHPLVVAAKWHGYYEYLHPFRDGNGRTGRLLSNFILLRADHPILIIKLEDRAEYISALKNIRTEGTDEHLIAFFFKTAINRMKSELAQKRKNTLPTMFF